MDGITTPAAHRRTLKRYNLKSFLFSPMIKNYFQKLETFKAWNLYKKLLYYLLKLKSIETILFNYFKYFHIN